MSIYPNPKIVSKNFTSDRLKSACKIYVCTSEFPNFKQRAYIYMSHTRLVPASPQNQIKKYVLKEEKKCVGVLSGVSILIYLQTR